MLTDPVSVIVPVFNEGECILHNSIRLVKYLRENLSSFEVILVENGSIDDTLSKAKSISAEHPEVRCFSLPEPCLGEALKTGVKNSTYDKVIYFPIDLSVNLDFIQECVPLLDRYHIVTGSKRLSEARDVRPLRRRIASRGYHFLVRKLFGTNITDTTCVKGYQRNVALELMNQVPPDSMIYETELLLEAQKEGLRVHQIPVTVTDPREGRQPLGAKISTKFQGLFSLRLDFISIILGCSMFLLGVLSILFLSIQKLLFQGSGFLNPYSYLSSMLLVIFGFQCMVYGSFARLILQLRRDVTVIRTVSPHAQTEGAGNVFKEKGQ